MTSLAPPGIADAYMLHHVMGHDRRAQNVLGLGAGKDTNHS